MERNPNHYHTIVEWLEATAELNAEKTVYTEWLEPIATWTYSELMKAIAARCDSLAEQGIKKGNKVLVLVKPDVDLAITLFALFKMGAVAVVIDPAVGLRTCLRCFAKVKADVIICLPLIKWFLPLFWYYLGSVKLCVTNTSLRRQAKQPPTHTFSEEDQPKASDLAAIFFTSGSTDLPKPVEWSHTQLKAHVASIPALVDLDDKIDLALFPLSMLISPVLGIPCHVPDYRKVSPRSCDTEYLISLFSRSEANMSFASPAVWYQLTDTCLQRNLTLPRLQYAFSGGAPISVKAARLIERIIPNGKLFCPYGATEASPIAFSQSIEFKAGLGVRLGKPVAGLKVKLQPIAGINLHDLPEFLGADTGVEIGEVLLCGDLVSQRYHLSPDLDKSSKKVDYGNQTSEVWHRTGDLAICDDHGVLWSLGRVKDTVKFGGRVYFTTVAEETALQLTAIDKAGYVTETGSTTSEPVLFVSLNRNENVIESEVITAVKDKLQQIHYPVGNVIVLHTMPVDKRHYSKIDRVALREIIEKGTYS